MANIIDMPKLSDTMTVGTLIKWQKKEGDAVKTGDILAEVETDKATMELESFFDGTLLKIFTAESAQVPIGAALCAIGQPGEKVDAPVAPAAAPVAPKAEEKPAAKPAPAPAPAPAAPAPAGVAPAAAPAPSPSPTPAADGSRLRISPLARKMAEQKGVDPSRVAGSGPGGRIVRDDILAAVQSMLAAAKSPSAQSKAEIQEEKTVPVSNLRSVIAKRLLESKTRIPHFYLVIEVDAEPMLTLRAQLNTAFEKDGVKLSVNDFILKASAEALRRVPAVNCSWEEPTAGQASVKRHGSAHVSFAVAIEDGLITPVIRDTQAKSVVAISGEAKALAKLAKEKKLQPSQYTGGTFCVSNLGMMGIESFSAIINPPNAAILAVGATVRKPVVKGEQIAIGQRLTLTLSCDHRVVDGATGATFLAALRELIEKPVLLLL